jgi:hypothetical protein
MSWFAHAVAGSLYALAFGSFATELYRLAGLSEFGLPDQSLKLAFMSLIIIAFTYLNYRGASEDVITTCPSFLPTSTRCATPHTGRLFFPDRSLAEWPGPYPSRMWQRRPI